ncbi:MAG: hypothetical protein HBSAPP03_13330 [Phycisphaerae bacterium]|nr:MAG: hypothetical protein HBSAPP03_13330 [Phycisphaerae bacterium]
MARSTNVSVVVMLSVVALNMVGTPAMAQIAPPGNPLPGPTLSAQAAPVGPQDPVFGPGDAAPNITPSHPPFDQIPSMPLPISVEGEWNPPIRGTVMVYDITTGQSREAPVIEPSGLPGGYHDGYAGIDGHVEMPEMDRNFGTMAPASSLNAFPASANCKLIMRFQNVNGMDFWFGCSGTMLDSGIVLTAAHCVYARDPSGIQIFDWAREIYVYPGWDGAGPAGGWLDETVIQNWGWVRASELIAGTDYVEDGNFDQDVGAIRISREWGRSVGMLTGWYGGAWGQSCSTIQSRTYYNYSFPGEDCGSPNLHNGRTMMFWSGTFDSCPSNQLQLNTSPGCYTAVWGGMSGSSAYYMNGVSRIAHAVCSNSNRSTTARYAKIWEDMANQITALSTANRGTVFDLTPMRFRLTGSTTIQATTQTSAAQFACPNPTNADPPSGNYTFRVYLSTNNQIRDWDTLLGTFSYSANYGAMQNLTVNVPPVTIPNVTPGTYWLGVVLDPGTDTNPDNNDMATWDAQPITVTAAPPPAPANNLCANAIPHVVGTSSDGTTSNATSQGSTTCGSNATLDVWYRVTPPATGLLQFETCGSYFDTVLSLHTACPGTTANQIACNDDGYLEGCPGTTQSVMNAAVTGGTTYYVRVAGFNGASGNFTLTSRYVPPANNDCPAASVHAIGTTSTGTLAGASNDGQASCGSSGTAADVWFAVTAPQAGFVRFDTCGSSFDTVLSVHTACPGGLANQVACNDDAGAFGPCAGTLQSVAFVGVYPGQTYYVRLSGFAGAVGGFSLNSAYVAAPNDACASALAYTPGTSAMGVTIGTANDGQASCGTSNTSPDVWYRMVANCTGTLRIDTCGSAFDTVLSVHGGACPGTTSNQLACNDDANAIGNCPGGLASVVDVNVYAGVAYYIRVSGYSGANGHYRLNSAYLITSGADDCENAPTIGNGSFVYSNCGATTDGPEENHCSFAGGDALISRDLWFRYVAPISGTITVDTCASQSPVHNTRLAVYAGSCPGGLANSAIGCNDDAGCGISAQLSRVMFDAVAGETYLVRVGGLGTARGLGTLTISSQSAGVCDADVNCDGAVNGIDVEVQELAVGGDLADYCLPDADFNQDGAVNGNDVEAVELVVGGGPCP